LVKYNLVNVPVEYGESGNENDQDRTCQLKATCVDQLEMGRNCFLVTVKGITKLLNAKYANVARNETKESATAKFAVVERTLWLTTRIQKAFVVVVVHFQVTDRRITAADRPTAL
jgi:hypothetical protein